MRLGWAIQSSWTNGVRWKLTRPICGIFKQFSGFEFFLLPGIVHARPSAMLRERKPLGRAPYKWFDENIH
jgi:hypothetical protein